MRRVREQLLADVRRRIGSNDPQEIMAKDALAEIDQLLGYLAVPEGMDTEVAYVLGLFALLRAELQSDAGERDRAASLTLLWPIFLSEPEALPDPVRSWISEQRGADLAQVPREQALAAALGDVAKLLLSRMARHRTNEGSAAVLGLARQAANGLPTGHPARAGALCTLGYTLLADLPPNMREADEAVVDEMITAFRDALDGLPPEDPNYLGCNTGLLLAMSAKAELTGNDTLRSQLSEALETLKAFTELRDAQEHLERVLRLTPEDVGRELFSPAGSPTADDSGTPQEPMSYLTRLLGGATDPRLADFAATHPDFFHTLEYLADFSFRAVNEIAIQNLTGQAARAGSDRPPPWLLPAPPPQAEPAPGSDLDEIIELHERTLRELPEDSPEYQQLRFLHAVLSADRMPSDHSADATAKTRYIVQQLPAMVQALSAQFGTRFTSRDEMENSAAMSTGTLSPFHTMRAMADAINRYRHQLATMSDDDPDRRATLTSLARALFTRYLHTGEGPIYQEAVAATRQTLTADSPLDPQLVFLWGVIARMNPASSGMSALASESSSGGAGSGSTLAYFKIFDGDASGALVALENERALMLSSALRTRGELDNLRTADPGLADRFVALRERISPNLDLGWEPTGYQREQSLIEEWNVVLNQIKSVPGFDRFLLPAPLEFPDLVPAAVHGPVVTVNLDKLGCDALVLHDGAARVVPLPRLNVAEVVAQAAAFRDALAALSTQPAGSVGLLGGAAQQVTLDTLGWLWDVLTEPVLDALGFTQAAPTERPWPRLWWSPSGPLNFLPLHAAGHHGTTGASVLDRVVSSYTPTVRALLHSRSQQRRSGQRTALAVAMPETTGHATLPATVREAAAIATGLAGTTLIGPRATRAAVCAALPGAALAHFACHANSDPTDAAASHLLLHDGPLEVTAISELELAGAELGYLSACATARGSAVLPDEAIHIGSALQLAGYAQVVGTLWEVDDDIAAWTAADFYRELARTINEPGRLAGAVALHTVTRRMRAESPDTPWTWAAYLHAGA